METAIMGANKKLGALKVLSLHQLKGWRSFLETHGLEEAIRVLTNEIESRKPKVVKMKAAKLRQQKQADIDRRRDNETRDD